MVASVKVIYLRIDHKLIPIFYHKQRKRKSLLGNIVAGFLNKKKKKTVHHHCPADSDQNFTAFYMCWV